jgi:hypothetical protein
MGVDEFERSLDENVGLAEDIVGSSNKRRAWAALGTLAYGIPAAFRYVTKTLEVPGLPFLKEHPWFIPPNLYEKLLVNSIFPGATAAVVIGESDWKPYKSFVQMLSKKIGLEGHERHVGHLVGGAIGTLGWTTLQYVGYLQNVMWPHGDNAFENPTTYPFNIAFGMISSVVTPYVVTKASDYLRCYVRDHTVPCPTHLTSPPRSIALELE